MANVLKKMRGKFAGAALGFVAGGPIGAAFGTIIGHIYDTRKDFMPGAWASLGDTAQGFSGTVQQAAFTTGVVVLGAKMAKADGRVTRAEIEAFKRVFNVTTAQENRIGRLFNHARTSADGFEPYAFQLSHVFKKNPAVLEHVLGGLFVVAAADRAGLSPAEMNFLERVAVIFDLGGEDFVRIAARAGVALPGGEKPRAANQEIYEILGVSIEASDNDIKLAYRALIREHHPDKLVAQGLPPEFMATAEEKMKRINAAYDAICKIRGVK